MGPWIYCKILIEVITICGYQFRCISILVFVGSNKAFTLLVIRRTVVRARRRRVVCSA
jgi:hypothetical protein